MGSGGAIPRTPRMLMTSSYRAAPGHRPREDQHQGHRRDGGRHCQHRTPARFRQAQLRRRMNPARRRRRSLDTLLAPVSLVLIFLATRLYYERCPPNL